MANQCVNLDQCYLSEPKVTPSTFEIQWQVGVTGGLDDFNISAMPEVSKNNRLITGFVGLFPTINNLGVATNGGIPQLGDWEVSKADWISKQQYWCPDVNFDGWLIVDFEAWLPAWEFLVDESPGVPNRYKTASINYATSYFQSFFRDRSFSDQEITAFAKGTFEREGAKWLNNVIALLRELRPKAKIAYYALMQRSYFAPYINDEGKVYRQGNDKLVKVLKNCDAIMPTLYQFYPSWGPCADLPANRVYTSQGQFSPGPPGALPGETWKQSNILFIYGQINEAKRLAKLAGGIKVIPYTWARYHDAGPVLWALELNRTCDYEMQTLYAKQLGCDGIFMWGYEDPEMQLIHGNFQDYIDIVIAPTVAKIYS